ncbi:sensor histidine kinase [Nannocystis sp. ILAH1]|uniref:sensor histidine kinase n=1 Tax=unclassified Nannocystis TaxID=2627009 RepID=UPI0022701FD9|nr:sensor histidine kinase [Nannocystis sp. ILAH1]MCY1064030.1 sensor histidine kinase [Nannocystis sp. RBIL2]
MFVEALRRHLELARRGLLSSRRFPTWLDDVRREARMLEIFEVAERELPAERTEQNSFLSMLDEWDPSFTRRLVEGLLAELNAASLFSGKSDEDEAIIDYAVRRQLAWAGVIGEVEPWPTLVRGRRIEACADQATEVARAEAKALYALSLRGYSEALRLTRTSHGETKLCPAGLIFLDLRGRDVMRWLLALEVSSAMHAGDPWCIDERRAKALASSNESEQVHDGHPSWPWDFDYARFEASGLVRSEIKDRHFIRYGATPLGVELFGELEQPSGEALRSLARATLADEAHEVLHGRPPVISEAAELGRHTRMVAHELRNILVPVQLTLKLLRRQGSGEAFVTANTNALDDIAGGLERALRFATETARAMGQSVSRDELFAVEAAVRDAIVGVQKDLRHAVEVSVADGIERVYLRGRRERFVLAILNLLRNACQVGGVEVRIFVRAELATETGARLIVLVEDDGPGVPAEQRSAIFSDGVSFRPGGSGHGLALVREVVEDELRGSIHYEPSARGGARFVLRLPIPLEGIT